MKKGLVKEVHNLAHYRYYFDSHYHVDFVENFEERHVHFYDVYFGFENFSSMHCFSIRLDTLLKFFDEAHEGPYRKLEVASIIKTYIEALSWREEYNDYQDFLRQIGDDYMIFSEFPICF